mgnify:CR=1 FL=1
MNLGDVMRELGLGSLVPDSGSNDGDETDAEAEQDDSTDDSTTGTSEDSTEESTAEPETEPEPARPAFSGADFEGDVGDAVEELQYELDDVRGRVDSNETSIEGIRNDQDRLEDRVDDIEETNATLLGIYDRLTDDINPFSGSPGEQANATPDDGTYGVMSGDASDDALQSDDDDDVVSFSDLKDAHDAETEEAAADAETEPEPDPDGEGVAETDDSAEPAQPSVTPPEPGTDTAESPYLSTLASTYATDVLLMEWVAMLVETAGPAGALKTVDYYAQINWISPSVKRQLETVLSGAYDVDDAGPSRPPSDLSVEAHNESFEHIQRLAQQTELAEA